MSQRLTFLTATLAVLAGCGHGDAFRPPETGASVPLAPGSIARLTYNLGRDQSPAWRAGGAGILYTFERVESVRRDWCLGAMPGTGGTRVGTWCELAHPDTLYAYDWAAEGPGGNVAFLRSATHRFQASTLDWWVRVGPAGDPAASTPRAAVTLPVSGQPLDGAEQVRWLDAGRLVWVGQRRFVGSRCRGCPIDTTATGRALVLFDLAGATPTLLPGTDYATSVAVRAADEVLFSRGGDSRVHRLVVSTGQATVVHDFGPGRIARDLQVVGDRLVAIVDGTVFFAYDIALGDTAQVDLGGTVAVVDLVTGGETLVALPFLARRPALSPDGLRVLVQTADRPEDLYLVVLP